MSKNRWGKGLLVLRDKDRPTSKHLCVRKCDTNAIRKEAWKVSRLQFRSKPKYCWPPFNARKIERNEMKEEKTIYKCAFRTTGKIYLSTRPRQSFFLLASARFCTWYFIYVYSAELNVWLRGSSREGGWRLVTLWDKNVDSHTVENRRISETKSFATDALKDLHSIKSLRKKGKKFKKRKKDGKPRKSKE